MLINEVFSTWKTKGIISYLSEESLASSFIAPWDSSYNLLYDLQYHGNNSGLKNISPLTKSLLDMSVDYPILTENDIKLLSTVILSLYSNIWVKIHATLGLVYNPIHNYDMIEEIDIEDTDTGTIDNANTLSHGKMTTISANSTNTNDASIYGFNTITPVNANKNILGVVGSGSESNSGSDVDTTVITNDLVKTRNQILSRSGNIGVMTTQQMIEQERKISQFVFMKEVFKNVDDVLTLKIY